MKKKLQHLWFYYKWYILAAALAVFLLVDFVVDLRTKPDPDYEVGIITYQYVPEATRDALEATLAQAWGDRNGDGQALVRVNFYQYDADTAGAVDYANFMAAAVQLAADLQEEISCWFFTDNASLIHQKGDGMAELGLWSDVDALLDVDSDLLKDFEILAAKEEFAPLMDELLN